MRFGRARHKSVRATPGTCAALPYPRKMIKVQIFSCCSRTALTAFAGLALCLQSPVVAAQSLMEWQASKAKLEQGQSRPLPIEQRTQVNYDAYILGPGGWPADRTARSAWRAGRTLLHWARRRPVSAAPASSICGGLSRKQRSCATSSSNTSSTYVRNPQVYVRPVAYTAHSRLCGRGR